MKKLIIMIALIASVGLIASQGLACWWDGYRGGPARGSMMGTWDGYGPGVSNSGTYSSFLNDTANLRQKLAATQGEYNALMAQSNPDVNKAAQLSKEIVRLHDQLRTKAQSAGLQGPGNYGPGYGPRHGGWSCW